MRHIFSVELDQQKRDYIKDAFEECEHIFADVKCFNQKAAFCYKCETYHDMGPLLAIDLGLSGPSCKDFSNLANMQIR